MHPLHWLWLDPVVQEDAGCRQQGGSDQNPQEHKCPQKATHRSPSSALPVLAGGGFNTLRECILHQCWECGPLGNLLQVLLIFRM